MNSLQRYLDDVQNTQSYQYYKKHWSAILLAVEFVVNFVYLLHGPLHPIDCMVTLGTLRIG